MSSTAHRITSRQIKLNIALAVLAIKNINFKKWWPNCLSIAIFLNALHLEIKSIKKNLWGGKIAFIEQNLLADIAFCHIPSTNLIGEV